MINAVLLPSTQKIKHKSLILNDKQNPDQLEISHKSAFHPVF